MIQCLYIQMVLHHPSGATSELNGVWANDWGIWKVSLYHYDIQYILIFIPLPINTSHNTMYCEGEPEYHMYNVHVTTTYRYT